MLQSGGVGAPGSTTDALFVIHSSPLSRAHTHTRTLSHAHITLDYCIHRDFYQDGECYWEQVANPYCCV